MPAGAGGGNSKKIRNKRYRQEATAGMPAGAGNGNDEKIRNKSYRYTIKKQQQGCQQEQGLATVRKS
jgi:hypothetical protein